jgi:hypothetical protein
MDTDQLPLSSMFGPKPGILVHRGLVTGNSPHEAQDEPVGLSISLWRIDLGQQLRQEECDDR